MLLPAGEPERMPPARTKRLSCSSKQCVSSRSKYRKDHAPTGVLVQKPEEESKAKVEGKTNASENKDLGRRRCRRRARSAALRSGHLEIAAALSAACSDLRSSEERRDLFSGVVRACVGAIVEYKCGRCRSTFGLREVAGRIKVWNRSAGCKS